jgi:hypothetical protein
MTLLNWAQFVALVLAGLFFVVKLAQGWLMVNLTLTPETERRVRHDGEHDDLAVSVILSKGGNGSVRIQETSVRVTAEDTVVAEAKLAGTSRLATSPKPPHRVTRPWKPAESESGRLYRLPPGEGTTWSAHLTVPTESAYTVEVVILGRQWPTPFPAQWRCSVVSLPVDAPNRDLPDRHHGAR